MLVFITNTVSPSCTLLVVNANLALSSCTLTNLSKAPLGNLAISIVPLVILLASKLVMVELECEWLSLPTVVVIEIFLEPSKLALPVTSPVSAIFLAVFNLDAVEMFPVISLFIICAYKLFCNGIEVELETAW